MLGRVTALALIMLGAAFTGCIGADDEAPIEEQETQGPDNVLTDDEAEVPDGREISAFKETNKTEATGTGAIMHAHDYWGGETRKVILQDTYGLIPIPLIPEDKAPGTAIADFDIPEPYLVYEGTGQVEILFTDVCMWVDPGNPVAGTNCTAPHPTLSIYVDYITAADDPTEWRQAGQATPDTPLVIPLSSPLEADMPHQSKSYWLFRIYSGEANQWVFNVTITAVKGNAVANWPPHPDLYADSPTRTIVDGPFTTETQGSAQYLLYGTDANWIYPDRVISYGTDKLTVTLTKKAFSLSGGLPTPAEPTSYQLEYHNASFLSKVGNGDLAGDRILLEGTEGPWTVEIPVDEYGMDSPYGEQSRWAFRLMARYGAADGSDCVDPLDLTLECQYFPYKLDYDMKIVATGHSISEEGVVDQQDVTEVGANETNES